MYILQDGFTDILSTMIEKADDIWTELTVEQVMTMSIGIITAAGKIEEVSLYLYQNYYTVDSRYLDPSYLDPITYVKLISKSRLFSLCIYCISASRMSNYFYVDTSAISSIIFSP